MVDTSLPVVADLIHNMHRSLDPEVFRKGVEPYLSIFKAPNFDFQGWLDGKNVMYEEDGSIGLATYEYPGVYTVHWFYTPEKRGVKALDLARRMMDDLFTNYGAELVRGLTDANLRGARLACRKLGYTSHGILSYPDGDYELFTMTKNDFYRKVS